MVGSTHRGHESVPCFFHRGEHRIRTCKPLRAPVFKTGAIAVLPALLSKTHCFGQYLSACPPCQLLNGNQFGNHLPQPFVPIPSRPGPPLPRSPEM
jgi:hypothetical protein